MHLHDHLDLPDSRDRFTRRRTVDLGGLGVATAALAVAAAVPRPAAAAPAAGGAPLPAAPQTAGDWAPVEQALGRSGQLQPGDVFRIGMPRTDLEVTLQGVKIQPTFGLGSYAAFKRMTGPGGPGAATMVMGDLVLLDEEVNPVLSGLFDGGLQVTAIHNHLNSVAPHTMYLHYTGQGDAVLLARALRQALGASGTPLGAGATSAAGNALLPATPDVDVAHLAAILGYQGRPMDGGVFQVNVARAETITDMGMEIPPAMGVAMPFNFQLLGDRRAAITGDFVLLGSEVNPVARTLRAARIDVTALHNHALSDESRLFYMHFWAADDALTLAQALRAALDLTNTAPRTAG